MKITACAAILLAAVCSTANAGSLKTLYTFTGQSDGSDPYSTLTMANGVLYGLVQFSGSDENYSAAFGFDISTGKFTTLYTFNSPVNGYPTNGGEGLTYLNGLLFGETAGSGSDAGCGNGGSGSCGTVYSLDPQSLNYTTLHTFTSGGNDGALPRGGMTVVNGSLYGVTASGGLSSQGGSTYGTIFKIDPSTNTETTIYSFTGDATGKYPGPVTAVGPLFYGTTFQGGNGGYGTIYRISNKGKQEAVLYNFNKTDNADAITDLAYRNKCLFGTTYYTAFKVSIAGSEAWSVPVNNNDPQQLVQIGGSFYGVEGSSGAFGYGSIYKINASSGTITTVYSFTGKADGQYPESGLIYSGGVLYGTTTDSNDGGIATYGTIFAYTP